MGLWVYVSMCAWVPTEGTGSPAAGVTGRCESPNMSIGNWTLVLCRSSQHTYPLTHPPAPGMGYFLKSSWKSSGFYYIAMGLTFPFPRSLLSWRLVLWRCLPGLPGCPLCILCHYAHRVLLKLVICSSRISNYLEIALAVPCHQVQPFLCLRPCPSDTSLLHVPFVLANTAWLPKEQLASRSDS